MDLEYRLLELKNEYISVQGDIEKLESTRNNIEKMEERLSGLEDEISRTKQEIKNQK